MKLWLAIFSAVLVAGLLLLVAMKMDRSRDDALAKWKPEADKIASALWGSALDYERGDLIARGSDVDPRSTGGLLYRAGLALQTAPIGANTDRLEESIARAKKAIAVAQR